MLDMYAQSLKNLGRKQEFIRAGLQILAKAAPQVPVSLFTKQDIPHTARILGYYLTDTINASRSLEGTVWAPLSRYIGNIFLDPYIQHFRERDGFQMSLELESRMPEAFEAHSVRVKLISVNEEQLPDIWLSTANRELLRPGPKQVTIQTTVCSDCQKFVILYRSSSHHDRRLVRAGTSWTGLNFGRRIYVLSSMSRCQLGTLYLTLRQLQTTSTTLSRRIRPLFLCGLEREHWKLG